MITGVSLFIVSIGFLAIRLGSGIISGVITARRVASRAFLFYLLN